MDFESSFLALIGNEGGYVNNSSDPGGETRYGISKRAYPGEDIANMTLDRAKLIYLRDYWGPAGCDAVPDSIKFDLFDTAVNSGVKTAIRMLQAACGEVQDGVLGPHTLQALQNLPSDKAVLRFAGGRLLHFASLPAWDQFGRGWTVRVANDLMKA